MKNHTRGVYTYPSFFKKVSRVLFTVIPIHFIRLVLSIFPNTTLTQIIRGKLISPFLGSVGKNFRLADGFEFIHSKNLHIGNDVYIARNCWINATANVSISDGAIISPNVVIATTKHGFYKTGFINKTTSADPIYIGSGSWLCSGVVVAKGVTIGTGSLVCPNSVVIKNVNAFNMVSGNPANFIKKIEPDV